ncbi:MAG: hypothetical protein KatS3mg111_1030 [Pirellulaceae bacterium]|nr:MAG: hypothetical protein KatS3mg111_1030 [Pirellulaceae bacterium]
MGQEIDSEEFSVEDFERFQQCLRSELELLRRWFDEGKFCDEGDFVGLELEAWLVDLQGLPAPDNTLFLNTLDRKWVVPELSKFNFEVNVAPQPIKGSGLANMRSELRATWHRCMEVAQRMEHRVVAIGILPTLRNAMLNVSNMSPLKRYAALNRQVISLRRGKPLVLEIEGQDRLRVTHHDLMLESAATSVQVHLKVAQRESVRFYNASLIASSLTVAMAANAPLLFGRRLWSDTRIPVFEQSVDIGSELPRVSFADHYVRESLYELFAENVSRHRVLLPVVLEEGPARMPYTRMHNGTIWPWNRPLIGFESDGTPHLRIEHRPMSASPSMADLFADVILYLGLVYYLARLPRPPEEAMPIATARENFYRAARDGLPAEIHWLDGKVYSAAALLQTQLLDHGCEALIRNGMAADEVAAAEKILRQRLDRMQNGAVWQTRKFDAYSGDTHAVLREYMQNQSNGNPVAEWV